jgi:hypothetical protein
MRNRKLPSQNSALGNCKFHSEGADFKRIPIRPPHPDSAARISCQNVRLLEKFWLCARIFLSLGFAEVAQANADEAKALLLRHIHSLPER